MASLLALLLLLLLFLLGGLYQRFLLWPAVLFVPARRKAWVSAFMRWMSASILGLLRLGGARALRHGVLPTEAACFVLMNHQSLLDIPTAVLIARPFVPVFVTRRRYARFVPVISLCMRLLGCPVVDPEGKRRKALAVMQKAAQEEQHGVLVFPEGHRTRDGTIDRFKTAGLEVMLRARPLPVYLLVTDGFWSSRTFLDFLVNIHRIEGQTEVLGPFPPPGEGEVPAFIERLRETMVSHLAEMRQRRHAAV